MTTNAKLRPDRIVFVLIDLQPKLLERIGNAKSIVASNRLLLETADLLGCSRIATSQYRKRLGDLADAIAPLLPEPAFDKTGFSCFSSPDFQKRLREYGKEWVVLSGIETHICVLQTCLDLRSYGFQVAIVTDAIGAGGEEDHQRGLQRMDKAGALMITTEMLIYELLGSSDTPEFKQLLPRIKEFKKQT